MERPYAHRRGFAYAYLAHGAKGLSHFCYQTPTTDEFYERQSGLFDKGAPTERWYYVQKIHGELKAFEEELLALKWEFIKRVDSTVEEENGLFNRQSGQSFENCATLKSVETDARCLVGGFKSKDGKEAFMLVNVMDTSHKKTVGVKVAFKKPVAFKIYKSGEVSSQIFNGSMEITLGVGEGIFMIEE